MKHLIYLFLFFIFSQAFANTIDEKSQKEPAIPSKPELINWQFDSEGTASWYGPGFHGRKTASGERFNTNEMTAAHKTLPFGDSVKVTNLDNGRTVIVRINDRGPFVKGRIIDLSKAAKTELEMGGLAKVKLERIKKE